MSLRQLISDYGYYAVFFGSAAEGETVLVLGGIAAHRGYLQLPWVIAAAFAGSWLTDLSYFFFGRRRGHAFLAAFPTLQSRAAKVGRLIERHPVRVILAVRFLYGFRIVGPMAIGMTDVRASRFLMLNTLGALVWAITVTAAGYLFSNALDALLPQVRRYEEYLFAAVIAAGILIWVLGRVRRSRIERRS